MPVTAFRDEKFFPHLRRLISDTRSSGGALRRLTLLIEYATSSGADLVVTDLGDLPEIVAAALGDAARRSGVAFR